VEKYVSFVEKLHFWGVENFIFINLRGELVNRKIAKKTLNNNTDSVGVSKSMTMRLPFYLRTLRGLLENNSYRTSSTELSKLMNLTASQIRQDLSAFGVSGLKGYGYDVKTLYTSILDIAGVRDEYSAVILGTKEMITMLSARPLFIKQGVALKNTFETTDFSVLKNFENYCKNNSVDIVVLATEDTFTKKAVEIIKTLDIKGIWNFSDIKLDLAIPVKNIWIDDSLMALCFELNRKKTEE
jgi:redox-sensing transcriptional repressor